MSCFCNFYLEHSPIISTSCTGTAHLSDSRSLEEDDPSACDDDDEWDPDDPEDPEPDPIPGEGKSTSEARPATDTQRRRSLSSSRRRCFERLR